MQRAVQSESIIDLAKQVSVSSQQIGTELDQLRAVGFPTEKDLQAYDTVLGSIAEQQKALSELHTMIELQALEQGMIQR